VELNRLDTIRKSAEAIRKHAEKIEEQVGTGQKKLKKILDDAKQTLKALNVELRDEAAERESPIVLDSNPWVENDVDLPAEGEE
jgi:hypothetical protein